MGRRRQHNWRAIEKQYVEGSATLKELSDQHRVPLNTIKKYSAGHGWSSKRAAYRGGQQTAIADAIRETAGDDLLQLVRLLQQLGARKLLEAVAEGDQIITPSGIKRLVEIEGLLKQRGGGQILIPMEPEQQEDAGDDPGRPGKLFRMVAGRKGGGSKATVKRPPKGSA